MLNRRAFLCGAMSAFTVPVSAGAEQTSRVYRVGFLRQGQPPKTFVEGFQQGLRERGYVDGQNVIVDFRFTDGSLDQLPQLAEELVRAKVDVILASASSAAMAAKRATTSVPIVFAGVSHPVEVGIVPSLAHPGSNITGVAINAAGLAGKRLELLRELVPTLRRIAMLSHPAHTTNRVQVHEADAAARILGMQIEVVPVGSPSDFEPAVTALRNVEGLLHVDAPLFTTNRARLAQVIARRRLPAIYALRLYVDAGGLISYGANIPQLYRRAATYVDKVLKGAKPADLPVEQPTIFELVINLKTARALGLAISPSLLLRADQVIE